MRQIEGVVVVGAGTMGHGIAQVCAMAGRPTVVVDLDAERVRSGLERVRRNLEGGVQKGKLDAGEVEACLGRLSGSTELEPAAARADLVVEAVPERLDVKRDLFARLERAARPGTILASNTSSLSITRIQEGLDDPSRVVGLHFFNPVHILKLVEVVRGGRTSGEVVDRVEAFARELGKEPIVVKDSPGFASSRLGIALGLEAMRMVEEEVASALDIDRAMELGYRHPMGPLRLSDLVGLDVRLDIARYLHQELGQEHFRPPAILERLVAEGKLGQKTGEGFHRWPAEG